jgi:hypothetical protein
VGKTYQNPLINNNRRYYWRYSIEFGSTQEFLTKMRGLSMFMMMRLTSPNEEILGLQGYDLSTAVAPAPVPANFVQLKRISSPQRGAPMGGFYISAAPVSQREYENMMKKNPSLVKNPAQPVNNVSIIDAMIFCNQMSIRDGLEPAYTIENHKSYSLKTEDGTISDVTLDTFASGYRLLTTDEWRYARAQVEGMGDTGEYVFDGEFIFAPSEVAAQRVGPPPYAKFLKADKNAVSDGIVPRNETGGTRWGAAPVIRVVRPIFDYWKYTSGQ